MSIARKPPLKPASIAADAFVPPALEAPMESMASPAAIKAATAHVEETIHEGGQQALAGANEMQEQFRKAVEQGVARSRATYDKWKAAAETATSSLETSYSAATQGVCDINAKAIDAMKAQSDATFDHLKALMGVKSVGEAIALQSAHARKQFESFTAQSKDFAELMQSVVARTAEPLKTGFAKEASN